MSTCAVVDGLVYVPEVAGYLYCLDAQTGEKVWDYDLKTGTWASVYAVDGKVFVPTDDANVFVFPQGRKPPPKQVPAVELDRVVKGSLVAADGVLYVQTDTYLHAIARK
jgi:outer membrane protein assembly factor BamB